MIIPEGLTARMRVTRSQLDFDKAALEAELIRQLVDGANEMGANTDNLHVITFESGQEGALGTLDLCARFSGLDRGEIIGGIHDGVRMTVDPDAKHIRVSNDRTASDDPLTDDNSSWYSRQGVSDRTGAWAYTASNHRRRTS